MLAVASKCFPWVCVKIKVITLVPRSHANFHGVRSEVKSTVIDSVRRRPNTGAPYPLVNFLRSNWRHLHEVELIFSGAYIRTCTVCCIHVAQSPTYETTYVWLSFGHGVKFGLQCHVVLIQGIPESGPILPPSKKNKGNTGIAKTFEC